MTFKFFLFLRALLIYLIIYSCIPKTTIQTAPEPIDHQSLIGTRWHLVVPHPDIKKYVEFIDETICHIVISGVPYPRPYLVKEHKIVFDGKIYEMKDDMLYQKGDPHWIMAD